MKRPAIIVDIDGTVADLTHRLHHLETPGKKRDWDSFYATQELDTPMPKTIEFVKDKSKDHSVLFITGRPDDYAGVTKDWLDSHFPGLNYELYMRSDYTPPAEYKKSVYNNLIKDRYQVVLALDDDQENLDMFSSLGIRAIKPLD